MEDESAIDERIGRLKKKKEKMQAQKALLLLKGAQIILEDKFSYELALSVLSNSWKTSSDKQKEEWIKSASSFRRTARKTKMGANPQSKFSQDESSRSTDYRAKDSQTATENP